MRKGGGGWGNSKIIYTQEILSVLFLGVNWLAGSQQRWPVWASYSWIGHQGRAAKTISVVYRFLRKARESGCGAHVPGCLCMVSWCPSISSSTPIRMSHSCWIFPLNLSSHSNNSHLGKSYSSLILPCRYNQASLKTHLSSWSLLPHLLLLLFLRVPVFWTAPLYQNSCER